MDKISSVKRERRKRIKKRIHKKISGTSERPRLVVFRSLRGIYAQLVDDSSSRTLCSVSSLSKDLKPEVLKAESKTETAKLIGKSLAEKAKSLKIEQVVFDRNGFLYHGRVKAVAEGAREAGLKF
jgi:large subunit ribosomal protein L18